jgi:hypothetical protein
MRKMSILVAGALALSGCAGANGGGQAGAGSSALATGECFRGDDVNNFNVVDQRTLYVSTRQGYVFRLDASADCYSQGTERVSVAPHTGGDPRLCVGDQARVGVSQFRAPPIPCIARVWGPITDSNISGLWSRSG